MAKKIIYFSILFISVFLVQIFKAYSINPDEVVVLANQRYAESVEIARYYMDKRNIKKDHLVLTDVSVAEEMRRAG
jgi:hypothetical protein